MPQRTISQDELSRVSSYLNGQGQKYRWVELWPRVVTARVELLDTFRGVSAEQAAWKPAPEDWSIEEVAQHVLDGTRNCATLVTALSNGRDPEAGPQGIGAIDPAQRAADLPFSELVLELHENARAFANVIEGLPEPPQFEPTSAHPFFGDLHGRAWYLFQRVHDLDHVGQINAIKQTEGYPA